MSSAAPIPITRKLTRWEEWRGVVYFFATVVLSSILLWHWAEMRNHAVKFLLGLGIFFDVMSTVAYLSTLITRRYSSGFLGFGFICFLWAWLSYPASVIIQTPQSLPMLWLAKLPDLVALFLFSACFHFPFWFMRPVHQQPR
jgi:hypothetical protein